MDGLSQATGSNPAIGLDFNNFQSGVANDDQRFLLYFIIGTYFGPDLKGERPSKSVLQRIAERLPPYTIEQLGGSRLKMAEVGQVYYYVLRKADQSAIVKLPLLSQFFHGSLRTHREDATANYPQFTDLFPLLLHPHSQFNNKDDIFENIVFIHNPEIYYIKPKDIERFKRLTGLEDFLLDRDAARLHTVPDGSVLHNVLEQEPKSNGESPPASSCQSSRGTKHLEDLMELKDSRGTKHLEDLMELKDPLKPMHVEAPISTVPDCGTPMMHSYMSPHTNKTTSEPVEKLDRAMIFLPSLPTKKELSNIVAATRDGFALTGSAAMAKVGPTIGLIDIGECDDSYLFRVSLPGVRRDEREFSCEVENEGQVLIRGVTVTGEKTVHRYSQMFAMQTQNLCPSGQFSISFQLPGPVNPQQFSGNFGTDGILEGIVMKRKDDSTASLVMAAMKGQGDDSSVFGPIVNDLRCFIAGMRHSMINLVQREGNEAAHRLARMGLSSSQECVWFEEPSDLIQVILVEEGL